CTILTAVVVSGSLGAAISATILQGSLPAQAFLVTSTTPFPLPSGVRTTCATTPSVSGSIASGLLPTGRSIATTGIFAPAAALTHGMEVGPDTPVMTITL